MNPLERAAKKLEMITKYFFDLIEPKAVKPTKLTKTKALSGKPNQGWVQVVEKKMVAAISVNAAATANSVCCGVNLGSSRRGRDAAARTGAPEVAGVAGRVGAVEVAGVVALVEGVQAGAAAVVAGAELAATE